MAQFKVTLKRVIFAEVFVEAESLAAARQQFADEDERWQAFNGMAQSFYGEETKLVKAERVAEVA